MKELDFLTIQRERRQFQIFDDFVETYKTTYLWTTLAVGSSPTVTNPTTDTGGQVALFTDAVQNNEVGIYTSQKNFLFAATKTMFYECNLTYTEANVNNANIAVGFGSQFNGTGVLTTGGVPAASFSGIMVYKSLGSTVWNLVTSVGSTQTITASQNSTINTLSQTIHIEAKVISATQMDVWALVNNVQLTDVNGRPIKQTLVFTGGVAMYAGAYARAGSASAETVNVDYVGAAQLR